MMSSAAEESHAILNRARQTLETAEHDLDGGYFLAVANRVYYAIYYCISALLNIEDIEVKTHQGARAKFAELYIKTGRLPIEFSEYLQKAADYRQKADYDFFTDIPKLEAEILIQNAAAFIEATRTLLQEHD